MLQGIEKMDCKRTDPKFYEAIAKNLKNSKK